MRHHMEPVVAKTQAFAMGVGGSMLDTAQSNHSAMNASTASVLEEDARTDGRLEEQWMPNFEEDGPVKLKEVHAPLPPTQRMQAKRDAAFIQVEQKMQDEGVRKTNSTQNAKPRNESAAHLTFTASAKELKHTALAHRNTSLQQVIAAVLHNEDGGMAAVALDWRIIVFVLLCSVGTCCCAVEHLLREQDGRRRATVLANRAPREEPAEAGGEGLGGALTAGKMARGEEEGTYKFGDFTRGVVAKGRQARGGDTYRPGDFTRGLVGALSGK